MTVIDIHGHVSSPAELYAYRSILLAGRGAHGRTGVKLPRDKVLAAAERHVGLLDAAGTDLQLISPRPFQLMHSEEPAEIVQWWARATNNAVADQVAAFPERFRGVAALPQAVGTSPEAWLEELERCVEELGFVGLAAIIMLFVLLVTRIAGLLLSAIAVQLVADSIRAFVAGQG